LAGSGDTDGRAGERVVEVGRPEGSRCTTRECVQAPSSTMQASASDSARFMRGNRSFEE
jgi:hypothetical protein